MYERIKQLLDYAENIASIGDKVLVVVKEFTAFIRNYFGQGPIDHEVQPFTLGSGPLDEHAAIREWIATSERAAPDGTMPFGTMPAWLLPAFLKLIEEVIDKWLRENKRS